MAKRTFFVTAVWDDEAKIFYSDSDIDGFHIEAETLEEFEELLFDLGPEMALANHLLPHADPQAPLAELVPAIIWQKPVKPAAA
jgi:hypothetical protein